MTPEEQKKIVRFEELLQGDRSSSLVADTFLMETDEEYARKRQPTTLMERRAKIEKERAEKEERIYRASKMQLPLGYENDYHKDDRAKGVFFDSIPDALVYCYRTLGKVDIEYISAITGVGCKEVILALKGAIYQNPKKWGECFYKGWEMPEEYLSGYLLRKRSEARIANITYNNLFEENIKAISSLLSNCQLTEDVYVHPASPWMPSTIHDEFIKAKFGKPYKAYSANYVVQHDEKTGIWEVPAKVLYRQNVESYSKYGTKRMDGLEIYERTLNGSPIKVTDEKIDWQNGGKKIRVENQAETILALEKQKLLVKTFQEWVWEDKQRATQLKLIFSQKYGYYRRRKFDGSFLTFPGLNPDINLFPYQKDAVARIILSDNVLLAHDVGSGKTYEMIAAGMELRRMRISSKNLYVVPNNILGQWEELFHLLYKDAKVFCVYPKLFTPAKREETLIKIRDEDFDGIIMPYSVFDKIALSAAWVRDRFLEAQAEINNSKRKWTKSASAIKKAEKRLKQETLKRLEKIKKYELPVYFDELGITRLFVDEAHNYKNVSIETNNSGIRGISTNGSIKCELMVEKVKYVQRKNNGKGVVMATGTPLTNSLTDAYVMQSYLQSGELALADIHSFDAWVGMFAEAETEFEIDVDTNSYRLATRLSKFHNMSQMTDMLSSIADFHSMEKSEDVPEFNGYTNHVIPQTPELKTFLTNISSRADLVHSGKVKRTEDNMLLITVDGRKAALDMRLIDKNLPFNKDSKVFVCASTAADIYHNTKENKLTQLIFCDSSTPSEKFNMYDEITRILVSLGVPRNEIAFVHDAKTEAQREKIFEKVRRGIIRILIGSTFKLGIGVNVQDKLIAIHHLDVSWRPADMVQRQGRILRQGNTNKEIFIHRYITEGSFDAYSWQLLEKKQHFINEILSGSVSSNHGKDIDDTVLDYAEVKALAIGNPLIKKRVEAINELIRLKTLHRKAQEEKEVLRRELLEIPPKQEYYLDRIREAKDDEEFVKLNKEKLAVEVRKEIRESFFKALDENAFQSQDTEFMDYRGFKVILPSFMPIDGPYVWLQRTGRYRVDMGNTEKGNLFRLDKCIDGLSQRIENYAERLEELKLRKKAIENQLNKPEDFEERIKECAKVIMELNKELKLK